MKTGKLYISLDFELHWGAAERWDVKEMADYFDNTRKGIPKMLALFEVYEIAATWATVGFLFAKNKDQLKKFSPNQKPSYDNQKLNYHRLVDDLCVGANEKDDPFHYASSLITQIIATPLQELATHTFSHYYCNESGQSVEEFSADLKSAQAIAKENYDITLESLVFPRNQFNKDYLDVVKAAGIKVVRTNPDVWFWKQKHTLIPLIRAFDTLIPISKRLSFAPDEIKMSNDPILAPASRFLRPYRTKEKLLQPMKKRRVLNEMTIAAKKGESYHLWWHPHNFGTNLQENLTYLEEILQHHQSLNRRYGFESATMKSISQ
ncbi:MAG TPA: polysaccharide deacetylase [Flavobacteriaceae bacterium]|jgi:peptidoglycan/xylan/chitin deacetylase (PgdA/CDA1 family)|nr:polysaccharide deacetylase [Flavobacteriaceae bacterium]HIN98594.1 polysaccharide deacetylase [Flavobacteriaceae bacterium]|tara:strand:+ start:118132 stop:119091 length:960 start_codon:yes stop_codon:yes gene_type:complete